MRRLHEEARLHTVLDTVVDGVVVIDARGNVLMFNPACERLFGYSAAEVIGQNVNMLMPEPYQHDHDHYLTDYRDTRVRKVIGMGREVLGRKKNGATFPMDLSVGEVKQDKGSLFVGVIHDLSNRKRTEEQLMQAQKMEAVGQLSGGIAHDFNNLLTVIIGNAEALTTRLRGHGDLRHLSETTITAAERGAELTQRLLAFSRRQVLQPDNIDCNQLLENMQHLLQRTLREDIELHVSFSATMLAHADRSQLESAILNLALNAQDAMPEGGALTLTTGDIELDPSGLGPNVDVIPGAYVMICVTDTGVGMTSEVRARVFEPFFTTKDVGKGSGLGLSMVYGFVKQSNGHISLYSEPDLGTIVRLFLPVAETLTPTPATAPSSLERLPRGAETILIVEDDPFVRGHAITSLQSLGYRVIVAADGREALAILQTGARPALMFTDVVMPGGINGWELVAAARAILPELKVLFTSGYPLQTLKRRELLKTSESFLNKPYRVAELARRMRDLLDG